MGDRESAARFLFGVVLISLLAGVVYVGVSHTDFYEERFGPPYTIENACDSNVRNGFYPYAPGCEEVAARIAAEEEAERENR